MIKYEWMIGTTDICLYMYIERTIHLMLASRCHSHIYLDVQLMLLIITQPIAHAPLVSRYILLYALI